MEGAGSTPGPTINLEPCFVMVLTTLHSCALFSCLPVTGAAGEMRGQVWGEGTGKAFFGG
jgi:hypothetical protein